MKIVLALHANINCIVYCVLCMIYDICSCGFVVWCLLVLLVLLLSSKKKNWEDQLNGLNVSNFIKFCVNNKEQVNQKWVHGLM